MSKLHLSERQHAVLVAMFHGQKGSIVATVDKVSPGETDLNFKGGIVLTVGSLGLAAGDKIEVHGDATYTIFSQTNPTPVTSTPKSGCAVKNSTHISAKR